MTERFHLGPGTLAYARALGFDIPAGGHRSLALEPRVYYGLFAAAEPMAADLYQGVLDHFGFETLDPALLIGLCSENLTSAALRIAQYKPLIGPLGLDVGQDNGGLQLRFSWPEPLPVPPLLLAIETLFWVALARRGPVVPQPALTVTLPALPPERGLFEQIIGTRVMLGARQEIGFSARAASAPFSSRRDDLVEVLQRSLCVVATDRSFITALRQALTSALPAGRATIGTIASDLGMSRRTLQRRLGEAGTSFRQELTAVRAALDAQLIEARGHSSAEAAFLLGFRDVNSLYRARKSWDGAAIRDKAAAE
jgi:AraC-like DNA-binding protein